MPNRPMPALLELDGAAQQRVAERMRKRLGELDKLDTSERPKFVVNVGDNFYPGGINLHCGKPDASATMSQFKTAWMDVYGEDLVSIEWWGVLGNHDYGGTCYRKAWDQQIYYTWNNENWVIPGQFWARKVQHSTFTIDFFFIDHNVFDTTTGTRQSQNICADNQEEHCQANIWPNEGHNIEDCVPTGPHSKVECRGWFSRLWESNYEWLQKNVPASTADWKVVVSHYPPTFDVGDAGRSRIEWKKWLPKNDIDLYICGHTHEQKIVEDFLPTAVIITGGGGGVTSEQMPTPSGHDTSYGFMDVSIRLENITISAYSHIGEDEGGKMLPNQVKTYPPVRKKHFEESFVV